jgi:hypothetical protein
VTAKISAAYFERKLRAILGMTGGNPIPDLGDVAGLLVVENDRPEWAIAGGEHFGWGREVSAAGAAGEASYVALVNPVASGVVAIVEAIENSGAANNFELFTNRTGTVTTTNLPGFGGSGTGRVRDLRDPALALACSTAFGATAAALGDGPGWAGSPSLTLAYTSLQHGVWILGQGTALIARGVTLVAALTVVFHWRERPLEGVREIK